jgi:hypothetical protein
VGTESPEMRSSMDGLAFVLWNETCCARDIMSRVLRETSALRDYDIFAGLHDVHLGEHHVPGHPIDLLCQEGDIFLRGHHLPAPGMGSSSCWK